MATGEKPNYLVVARSILVGAIATFCMKYLWDIMLETWPSHPEIIKLQRKYAVDPRVAIVSISCGSTNPESIDELEFDTKIFVQGLGGDLPIYCDPAMYSRIQIANIMGRGGFAYPTTLLLNRQMKILDAWVGATNPGELDRALSSRLSSKP